MLFWNSWNHVKRKGIINAFFFFLQKTPDEDKNEKITFKIVHNDEELKRNIKKFDLPSYLLDHHKLKKLKFSVKQISVSLKNACFFFFHAVFPKALSAIRDPPA